MEQRGFIFHGTDGEAELSIEQVRELAAKDDPEGLYALAMAYLFGWDVEADEDRGYELLEKAVDLGNTDAMALMVRLYMQDEYQGIDNERAAELSVIAAKDGIPEAQLYAGLAYMDGIHVPQDYKEAARYLTLAANQGDQEARTALAYLYENGFGVAKDESKALKMYRTAARGGSVNAMFHVGVCYEFGNGTPVDLEQARSWYQKGAQAGDAFAMERLGHLTMQTDPALHLSDTGDNRHRFGDTARRAVDLLDGDRCGADALRSRPLTEGHGAVEGSGQLLKGVGGLFDAVVRGHLQPFLRLFHILRRPASAQIAESDGPMSGQPQAQGGPPSDRIPLRLR